MLYGHSRPRNDERLRLLLEHQNVRLDRDLQSRVSHHERLDKALFAGRRAQDAVDDDQAGVRHNFVVLDDERGRGVKIKPEVGAVVGVLLDGHARAQDHSVRRVKERQVLRVVDEGLVVPNNEFCGLGREADVHSGPHKK